MIALIADEMGKYITEETARKKGFAIDNLTEYSHDLTKLSELLINKDYTHYVIDIDVLVANTEDIVVALNKLKQVTSAQMIIFAHGYSADSYMIESLRYEGFRKFVIAEELGDLKAQMSECLEGTNNIGDLDIHARLKLSRPESGKEKKPKNKYTIGLLGSQNRIGTTTQAIQLAKHLQQNQISACYVEAGNQKHVIQIPQLYEVELHKRDLGLVRCEGLDMYYNVFRIDEILHKKYDVFIYDYGVFDHERLYGFFEKDIRVVVAGAKPWEIENVNAVLRSLEDNQVNFIFNFMEDVIRPQVNDLMKGKCKQTHFSAYSPNMFSLNLLDKEMHENIVQDIVFPDRVMKKKSVLSKLKALKDLKPFKNQTAKTSQ